MKITIPRIFAPLTNSIPLSYLDDDFNAIVNALANTNVQNVYNIDQYTDLTAAVAAIGSTPCTLVIATGTTLTANTTVPSTMRLLFIYPGTINQGTFTLTVNSLNNRVYYNALLGTGTVTGLFQEVAGTSAPASGYWSVGSRCYNSAPAAGLAASWVCVTAGVPGTWETEYTIGTFHTQVDVTATRAVNTVYGNTTGRYMHVSVSTVGVSANNYILGQTDSANPPTSAITQSVNMSGAGTWGLAVNFLVKPGNYYQIYSSVPLLGLTHWLETT